MRPVLLLSLSLFLLTSSSLAQSVNWSVSLSQDTHHFPLRSSKLSLRADSFSFVFHFTYNPAQTPKPAPGIFVYASTDKKTHKQQKKALRKKREETELAMAEGLFNTDKELILSVHSPSYWFYDDPYMHRFDRVIFNETETLHTLHCHRSIHQFYTKESKETSAVNTFQGKLYLLFWTPDQKAKSLRLTLQ
jgi:hypothetical protein